MTAGLVILAVLPASTPVWTLAALMALVGLAGPLVMPPVTAVLLNSVPGHRAGTASGVFNTSRQVGGALAVAVFGALLAQPGTFLQGLRSSLLLAAAVGLAAAASSLLLKPPHTTHKLKADAARQEAGARWPSRSRSSAATDAERTTSCEEQFCTPPGTCGSNSATTRRSPNRPTPSSACPPPVCAARTCGTTAASTR
ncbi:MAG TPA: MFS transporter [Pseudonocardiaceae bacterium]|nr:MFS transporter [Pseudonocardiaceae bacterium]